MSTQPGPAQKTTGPLAGVRVIELVGLGPCPFAAMLLADLGAEVIRVDRPRSDGVLALAPSDDLLGRGRPNVALDLKTEGGRETVLRLAESADILIEGFRPGVTERLGIGPEPCLDRNPALVYGRMTGWGQTGPLAERAGHDLNYIALAGGLEPMGRAGGPPQIPLNLVGDFGGGSMYLVTGVLAALIHARASGEGQVVDAAIVDGVGHLQTLTAAMQQAGAWNPERGTNLFDSGRPYYDVYKTSDHRWMSVAPLEPQFWAEFCDVLAAHGYRALPDRDDPGEFGALRRQLGEIFATRSQAEWTAIFDGTDACVSPVVPLAELRQQPHLAARGTWKQVDDRWQPAPAPRFSATEATLSTSPHAPGADTRAALLAWGIDDADDLIASGAAHQA